MKLVTIEAKSHKGKNRLSEARRRLPSWDGKTWRVVQERPCVVFSDRSGPWLHIAPHTDENVDWLSRWVSESDDADFAVAPTGPAQASAPSC